MRRRDFLRVLGGAAAAWPVVAPAQPGERVRRIGALLSWSADDPESQMVVGAFSPGASRIGPEKLGSNVRIDYRWAAVDDDRIRQYAADLVALAPDVILASGSTVVRALLRATSTLPIVFANTGDPVGGGLVASLAQPRGGNAHWFPTKWLELLKQIAPHVTRAAVIRDPTAASGLGEFGAIMGAGPTFGIEVSPNRCA